MGAEVFVTGGTGYVGRPLIASLLGRGHGVRALVRRGSESRVPAGCEAEIGDPFDEASFSGRIPPARTFVQLLGVPHPSPAKAAAFLSVDLASVRVSARAARAAGIRHFVYVSVARPAPVMKAYQEVRAEGERLIVETGIPATFVRPWYVLGPGHRWPLALVPFYRILEKVPATRDGARRLGLVTLAEMVGALVAAVEDPPREVRIVEPPGIRASGRSLGERR
ncbi:MAG: NAD(P)H-binding protein [Acidobacteria bacterium]|nr:NAD(P)H-binding protein [Acidobacteriota bacterium]